MKYKRFIITSMAIVLALVLASCGKNIREYKTGSQESSAKMLIAASSSDFKNVVIDGLVAQYQDICYIKVMDMNKLKYVKSGDYDVIVLIDRALAWTIFNFSVRKFIDATGSLPEKEKIVLFLTVNDEKWDLLVDGVDGVTSASKMDRTPQVMEKLTKMIDKILTNKKATEKKE